MHAGNAEWLPGANDIACVHVAARKAATTANGQSTEEYEFKLSEAFMQRLATLNPVATTLFYEHMCEAIFTHLVGLPPTGKRNVVYKPAAQRQRALFGVLFCASAVTELNQRRSMHFHACINGGTPPALLRWGTEEREGARRRRRAMCNYV